jgi:hypothetical protein
MLPNPIAEPAAAAITPNLEVNESRDDGLPDIYLVFRLYLTLHDFNENEIGTVILPKNKKK